MFFTTWNAASILQPAPTSFLQSSFALNQAFLLTLSHFSHPAHSPSSPFSQAYLEVFNRPNEIQQEKEN